MQEQGALSFIVAVTKPFRHYVAGMIAIACMWAFLLNAQPYIIKLILNTVTNNQSSDRYHDIGYFMLLYFLSELVYIVVFRVYDWITIKFRPALKKHIGVVLMDNMMEHAHSFYQHQFAGNLTTRIIDIMVGIPDIIRIVIDKLFACGLLLLFALYNISLVDMKFMFILLIWIIFFLVISVIMIFRNQYLAYDVATARAVVGGHIVDILTNMASIRFFATKKFEHTYLEDDMDVSVHKDQARDWFFLKLHAFQGFSFLIFQMACCWWLYKGLIAQTVTPGDFVLILALNFQIVENFWNIAKEMREFWEKMGNIVQGLSIIQAPIDITDKPSAKPLRITKGEIVFDKVQFRYSDALTLFEHTSVVIKPGEKVGLVGYSGSGKSTFVNLILRVFDVTAGSITIDGQDIRDVTQDSLHRAIAMIPQDPTLFHRSIRDNIAYGCLNATQNDIIAAAKGAYAHEFITAQQYGYDTPVGERGVKLSGGQRQRIVIARAILKNASILILDEATSQLDAITETEIQASLWNLMEGKTTLVIAHRLSTLLHMDRILVFDKGAIIEQGSHEQLLAQNGLYKQLWDAQVGGFLSDDIH